MSFKQWDFQICMLPNRKTPEPWNPGCLIPGSLFHASINNPPYKWVGNFIPKQLPLKNQGSLFFIAQVSPPIQLHTSVMLQLFPWPGNTRRQSDLRDWGQSLGKSWECLIDFYFKKKWQLLVLYGLWLCLYVVEVYMLIGKKCVYIYIYTACVTFIPKK